NLGPCSKELRGPPMKAVVPSIFLCLAVVCALPANAQNSSSHNPTWWNKYQYLLHHPAESPAGPVSSLSAGANVDVSNECGPQSEPFIATNPGSPSVLAAGSNEIFRDPMRGYFSADNGSTWGGVDLPLPAPIGANGIRFGSDPTLAFDTRGNVFYGYI